MTYAEVIALINANVTTNGNNEITGAILNSVLQAMLTQPNDLIGNLTDLNTDVDTDIVAAINWILTQLDGGAQLHSGIPDPNVTPPAEYGIGDLYSQTNVGLTPIALWIYTGVLWFKFEVSGGGQVDSVAGTTDQIEVDDTDPANPILSLAPAVTDSLALADTAVQPDELDAYIPLSGTDSGSPVTGDIETDIASEVQIFAQETGVLRQGLAQLYTDSNSIVSRSSLFVKSLSTTQNGIIGIDFASTSPFLKIIDISGNDVVFNIGVNGAVINDNIAQIGLVGDADYSANYTDLTYVQKKYVDTLQTTSNDITFARPRQFGTFTTPLSGAITNTLTGAVIGKVQKIYHQDSSLTVPGTWVLISGTYNPSQKNIIYVEWSEGTRCEYWIVNL